MTTALALVEYEVIIDNSMLHASIAISIISYPACTHGMTVYYLRASLRDLGFHGNLLNLELLWLCFDMV